MFLTNKFFLSRALAGVVVCLLALHTPALAQPSSGGPVPQSPTATAVPLDGGAGLLLVSGVAYGLRRLRQRRRA